MEEGITRPCQKRHNQLRVSSIFEESSVLSGAAGKVVIGLWCMPDQVVQVSAQDLPSISAKG